MKLLLLILVITLSSSVINYANFVQQLAENEIRNKIGGARGDFAVAITRAIINDINREETVLKRKDTTSIADHIKKLEKKSKLKTIAKNNIDVYIKTYSKARGDGEAYIFGHSNWFYLGTQDDAIYIYGKDRAQWGMDEKQVRFDDIEDIGLFAPSGSSEAVILKLMTKDKDYLFNCYDENLAATIFASFYYMCHVNGNSL